MSNVKLDTKELDRIAAQLDTNRTRICVRFAFQAEGLMKQLAVKDTSAMANSVYTVTKDDDGYSQAAGDAHAKRPNVETEPHPKPEGNIIARVGPCVNYAGYVEFGTSKMAAQPFVGPSIESLADRYNSGKEWEELVK